MRILSGDKRGTKEGQSGRDCLYFPFINSIFLYGRVPGGVSGHGETFIFAVTLSGSDRNS